MTLQASAPLSIQTASKAKRGYVLAGGESYSGYKAPALALAEGISVDEAPRQDFSHLRKPMPPRTTMRCWTAAILKACTSFASLCAGCARPSWSSRLFSRPRTPPGWSREACRLIDLLGPARDWDVFITETLAAVRRARPRRHHSRVSRSCGRGGTGARLRAGGGVARARTHVILAPLWPVDRDRRLAGARRTAPYSTSRSRVSGGPCSTGGTSRRLSVDAISRDSRTTVFTGSGSRSRSCATRASFSPLNSPTASRAPISGLCAGSRTTSAASTTLPSLSAVLKSCSPPTGKASISLRSGWAPGR